jgi:hypothetical protein
MLIRVYFPDSYWAAVFAKLRQQEEDLGFNRPGRFAHWTLTQGQNDQYVQRHLLFLLSLGASHQLLSLVKYTPPLISYC